MHVDEYKKQVEKYLSANAKEITRVRVVEIHTESYEMLESMSIRLSKKEVEFLTERIKSKAIPSPKLLIKDHKDPDENGCFDLRLAVPATNFTAGYSLLGGEGIKTMFESKGIVWGDWTIIQAVEMKEEIELYSINKSKHTLAKIDAVAMYHSIEFTLIEDTIGYYASQEDGYDRWLINGEDQPYLETAITGWHTQ
jgi:hypothetical protein